MKVDKIVFATHMITMEGNGVGYRENAAIAIKDNKIINVDNVETIKKDYKTEEWIDGTDKLVMPGLIDAHIHTGISIFRGVAQDMNNWMQKGLWPFMKHLTKDASVKGSLVNILEGIKAGTTTFCDYDTYMPDIASNYAKTGVRARLAELVNEIPDDIGDIPVGELYPFYTEIGDTKLQRNIDLIEQWHASHNGRITCILGPHGPDMMSLERLKEMHALAEKYDTKMHMHVAQGDREIDQIYKRYKKRSIAFLDENNLLNDRLMAVHLTEATEEEAKHVAKSGASLIYCSGSIGIIDGLVPPVVSFSEAGGTLALGSDQAPGNNCNNMFNEMKFAAILNKVKYGDPTVFTATKALRAATIDAAKAIGLEHEIGSLEPGKKADIIFIDMNEPNLVPVITTPIRNIVPNLVYSARGHEVTHVMVDGEFVMEDRIIKHVDDKAVIREAQEVAKKISKLAEQDIITSDSDIVNMMTNGEL